MLLSNLSYDRVHRSPCGDSQGNYGAKCRRGDAVLCPLGDFALLPLQVSAVRMVLDLTISIAVAL